MVRIGPHGIPHQPTNAEMMDALLIRFSKH